MINEMTRMNMLRNGILLLIFLITGIVKAQDGWQAIKDNDNRKAREYFKAVLEKDSLNVDALKGMIYLCEVDHDDYDAKKYTERMVEQIKQPAYYFLFGGAGDADEKTKASIPEKYLLDNKFSEADDLFYDRKFSEAQNVYASTVSNFKWSYIGPFKNMNGYGFEVEYPVEKNNFEFVPQAVYTNHNHVDLKWVSPAITDNKGFIQPRLYCPEDAEGVYYANTYIELPAAQKVYIKLSREYPIKIWIDNQLIMSDREKINYAWDAEEIQVQLAAGWHRIMIKYCIGDFFTGKHGGGMYGGMGDYDDYEDYNYSIGSNGLGDLLRRYGLGGGNRQNLCLRFTHESGKIIEGINSSFENKFFPSVVYAPVIIEKTELAYFKSLIDKNPEDWFNYYLYFKTAIKGGYTEEIEEFSSQVLAKYPDKVFFKFLVNEVFNENGKKEKADKIISGIDFKRSPVFSLMYNDLKQIDSENEPELYLAKVNEIREIAPGNLFMMRKLLDHYEKLGNVTERKSVAKDLIKKYPRYEYMLKDYLEDDNKPEDYDIGNRDDYSSKKQEKNAAKSIKKYFATYDYETLIKKYKGLNQPSNALKYYDEVLKVEPFNNEFRSAKAEYLFNLERHDEALAELQIILTSHPYDASVYELMGDIYKDKEDNVKALTYYKIAKEYNTGGGANYFGFNFGGGGSESLDDKIDKIQGSRLLKSKFSSKSLDDLITDNSYEGKYSSEESVILGFVYDVMLEKDGTSNLFSKMAIKILTDAGAKSWTEYDFSFLGNLTTCKVVKANGSEFNPDKSGGFVVFKNLEPGDIIKLEGNYKWNVSNELGKELIQFNYLNFHVPIHYAKVEYGVPSGTNLNYLLHHIEDNLQKRKEDETDFYKWEFKELRKMVQEEAVVDQTDMFSSLMVSTVNNWAPVVEWYKAKSYRKLEPNYELRTIRDSIIKPGMKDEEKVIAIYNYITEEINYSYTRLLQSNYIPKNTDLTISSRIGDCKDVASLMIALLQMEGIESYYCLVKTNQFFHQKTLPSLYFDHVIAAYVLNGKMNFVDLTTDYYPYYVLNENDVNAWGLLIKDGETEIFQLPSDHLDPTKNLTIHEIHAQLDKDKSVTIKSKSTFNGLTGGLLREINAIKSKDNLEQEVLYYLGDGQYDNLSLENYSFENINEITTALKGEFNFRAINFSDNIVDIYFTRVPLMQGIKSSTIFSSNKRFNTIKLGEIFRVTPSLQKITLDFPKGTTLRKLPADIKIDNEFVKYTLTFKKTPTGVYVERYQEFKKDEIKAEEFKSFRELYFKLLDHDKTKIGLVVN